MSSTRHLAESSSNHPPIPADAELLGKLEVHHPYLPDPVYENFVERTIDYLGKFPADTVEDDASELDCSSYNDHEAKLITRNEVMRDDGLVSVDELRQPLIRRIKEEFMACRMDDPADAELEKAVALLEAGLTQTKRDVNDKSQLYLELLEYSASRTDIAAEELVSRMTEALGNMSDTILESPIMPEPPTGRFRRKEKDAIYASWERSKAKMLGKIALPERDDILNDYYRSADATFRRTLYGSRDMRLDRGVESDSTEEIDSFQRRFYDQLGGYKIPLTPREWASQHQTEFVDWLLYAPESPTAQKLNIADQKNAYSSRKYRAGKYNESTPKDNIPNDASSFIPNTPLPETLDPVEVEPEYDFEDQQWEIYKDMQLLVDSRLMSDPAVIRSGNKISREARGKFMDLCAKVIKESPIDPKKFAPASDEARLRIMKNMMIQVHPDREDGGNAPLCKIITDLQARIKAEQD